MSILAAFFFSGALFAAGLVLGAADSVDIPLFGNADTKEELLAEALVTIRERSVDPPSESALEQDSVREMVNVLRESDDYARFYTPEDYNDFLDYAAGRFEGVGVILGERKQSFVILSVLPSTPARDAGLRPGDELESVDGSSVSGLSSEQVVGRVKGPEGTEVEVTVERDGRSLDFEITRAEIDLPNASARLVRGNIGYIRLFGFGQGAGDQVRMKIESLLDQGAEGIVLDMRNNGGGLFSESIEVASIFIEDGEIVSFQERGQAEVDYDAEGDAYEDLPVVVLVNGLSASATEIVAGALKAEDRAPLVGSTTFGKGSVQEVVPLSDASAIKLTTGTYLTPDGQSIEGTGVAPDVLVKGPPTQKTRALEILEAQISG